MAGKKKNKDEKVPKKAPDALDVAKKALQKKYGDVVKTMAEIDDSGIISVPTGCIGLDTILGRGGIPLGTFCEIYGPPSGGKTTLAMSIIAQAQKKGLKCLLIDAERACDPPLYEAMGVDNEALETVQAYTGDENLDALEQLVKTGSIDVAVVDSVSALIPKAEAEEAMEKQQMGLQARLMSKALRKLNPVIGSTNTLIIFINQTRNKITMFGDPETTSGGMALPFFATTRIKVTGGDTKSTRIKDSVTGEIMGHITTFETKKNRKAKPFQKATIPLIYGKGYEKFWEVLNIAVDYGVIEKSGSWFSYEGKKIGQGEQRVLDFFNENTDVYMVIRDEVLSITGLKDLYEQNS